MSFVRSVSVRSGTLACLLVGVSLSASPCAAQTITYPFNPPARPDFTLHWCVTTSLQRAANGAAAMDTAVDLTGTPFERNAVVFYAHQFGEYPIVGMHEVYRDPNWQARNLAKIPADVAALIPDANWNGIALIDYENWQVTWEVLFPNLQVEWENALRAVDPHVFDGQSDAQKQAYMADTYNSAARTFYTDVITLCKRLRPHTRWTYGAPQSMADYGNHTGYWSRVNDRMQWLWDACDVLAPCLYSWAMAMPDGTPLTIDGQTTYSQYRHCFLTSIEESHRVCPGKPVYPMIYSKYAEPTFSFYGQYLNDTGLTMSLELPYIGGCNGVVLWDHVHNAGEVPILQAFIDDRFAPKMVQLVSAYHFHGEQTRVLSSAPSRADVGNGGVRVGGAGQASTPGTDGQANLVRTSGGAESTAGTAGGGGAKSKSTRIRGKPKGSGSTDGSAGSAGADGSNGSSTASGTPSGASSTQPSGGPARSTRVDSAAPSTRVNSSASSTSAAAKAPVPTGGFTLEQIRQAIERAKGEQTNAPEPVYTPAPPPPSPPAPAKP